MDTPLEDPVTVRTNLFFASRCCAVKPNWPPAMLQSQLPHQS